MGAEYLFYVKSIETHARAFLALIILGIGTVECYSSTTYCLLEPELQSLMLKQLNSQHAITSGSFRCPTSSKPLFLCLYTV